jgi:hypothetical protein
MRLKTGPQTDAAKAVTSQNARTHGLSAKVLLVLPDDQPQFDQLRDKLLVECKPEGALEEELFRQIVNAQWNLRRCDCAEQEIFAATGAAAQRDPSCGKTPAAQGDPSCGKAMDPFTSDDEKIQRQLDRVQRYRTTHTRAWHRALRELRNLQTNRLFLADADSPRPPLADEMKLLRYLDAHSRIKARDAAGNHRQADTEFKQWWNRQERSLAEAVAAADAEIAARRSAAASAKAAQTAGTFRNSAASESAGTPPAAAA